MAADLDQESQENTPQPAVDETLQKALDKALYAGGSPAAQQLRNFLNGVWLGEPLHAVLTDVPVGAWTAAMAFDLLDVALGNRGFAAAADAAVTVGLVGAAGAAVTGMTDWSDVDPPARRVGLIHGLLNLGGTALFATSLLLRGKKYRRSGRAIGAIGYAVIAYAAHLGGEMVYKHRVGVDRTDGQPLPEEFAAVLPEAQLAEDQPTRAMCQGVPIVLVRRGDRLFGLADTCSHFGASLSEGQLRGNSIVCPYHSSQFNLEDGCVIDGPAVHPQPCLEVRARDGQIEVRKAARG